MGGAGRRSSQGFGALGGMVNVLGAGEPAAFVGMCLICLVLASVANRAEGAVTASTKGRTAGALFPVDSLAVSSAPRPRLAFHARAPPGVLRLCPPARCGLAAHSSGKGERRGKRGRKSASQRVGDAAGGGGNQQRRAVEHGVKRGDTLTVDIESLAGGTGKGAGCGVARVDGLIFFIEGALPGSQVQVAVTDVKRDYIEAKIQSVAVPSPDAVASPCAFFRSQGGGCGGCRLLGMSYDAQLREKQSQVDQVFGRWALQNGTIVHPILGADAADRTRHRNRLDLAFAPTQWIPPPEGGSALGGVRQEAPEPVRTTGSSAAAAAPPSTFLGLRPAGVSDAVIDVGVAVWIVGVPAVLLVLLRRRRMVYCEKLHCHECLAYACMRKRRREMRAAGVEGAGSGEHLTHVRASHGLQTSASSPPQLPRPYTPTCAHGC